MSAKPQTNFRCEPPTPLTGDLLAQWIMRKSHDTLDQSRAQIRLRAGRRHPGPCCLALSRVLDPALVFGHQFLLLLGICGRPGALIAISIPAHCLWLHRAAFGPLCSESQEPTPSS